MPEVWGGAEDRVRPGWAKGSLLVLVLGLSREVEQRLPIVKEAVGLGGCGE